MKKTLIALMALAGVAAAATEQVNTIDAAYTGLVKKGQLYADGYTFTFTLDELYKLDESGKVLGFYRGTESGNAYGYNAIVLGGSDDALTLTIGRGKASTTDSITAGTTFAFQDKSEFTTTIQKGVEYTITLSLREEANAWGGMAGYLTPVLTWGDSGKETGTEYNGGMNGNAIVDENGGLVNGGFVVAVNTGTITIETPDVPVAPSVPEPTTATLSLLALAGLAARRRRK